MLSCKLSLISLDILSLKADVNVASDLDSLCSAIVFAYLRTYTSPTIPSAIHVPLSNLLRGDLSLRPELRPVLSRAHIGVTDLITISELPPSDQRSVKLKPQHTRWLLVDHNSLQGDLGKAYSGRVVGTIDHHDEENQVPKDCGNEPRIITKTGSCTSLVIQYCREAWDAVSTKSQIQETASWDAELAYFALAPILIDTNNLKDSSKVTATDVEAVQYLESKIDDSAQKYNRDDYFKQISSAKSDIGALSLGDILRKDYKQWVESKSVNLGISSVVKDVSWLLEKTSGQEAFLSTVRQFVTDRKLSLYAIMTILLVGEKVQRELFIYAQDEKGAATARFFEEDAAKRLGLTPWEEGKLTSMRAHDGQPVWGCWNQSKVENSRKQVAPLLRKAFNDA